MAALATVKLDAGLAVLRVEIGMGQATRAPSRRAAQLGNYGGQDQPSC
jgi:hypothetical protein